MNKQARELVDSQNKRRSHLAAKIRHIVGMREQLGPDTYRAILKDAVVKARYSADGYWRPSAYNLRIVASNALAMSREPIGDCGDSEYYSRCGAADHEWYKRQWLKEEAITAFQAWKSLTGK